MTNEELMALNKDGGTAFPAPWGPGFYGMTLRDWFAGMAIANIEFAKHSENVVEHARWVYGVADAMLAQRAADKKARNEAAGDQAEELRDA